MNATTNGVGTIVPIVTSSITIIKSKSDRFHFLWLFTSTPFSFFSSTLQTTGQRELRVFLFHGELDPLSLNRQGIIKDPSISQKHLTVNFLPEISRWVVTDLGSSNGTYVNGSLISPDEEPTSLSDGDVIKIGELTSISVKISDPVNQPLMIPRCDRPPRPPKQVKLEDKEWEERKEAVGRLDFFVIYFLQKRRKAATAAGPRDAMEGREKQQRAAEIFVTLFYRNAPNAPLLNFSEAKQP